MNFNVTEIKDMEIEIVLQWYLMASYMYYIEGKSLFPDVFYDTMAMRLLEEYDSFEHNHKYLIQKEDLSAGTLYGLGKESYPNIIKSAAMTFYDKIHIKKIKEFA